MNRKQKELVKIFIFIFVFSFIIINWDSVSWLFNYRELYGLTYDFFNPYQDHDVAAEIVYGNPKPAQPAQPLAGTNGKPQVQRVYPYSAEDNSLKIPALHLETPLVIGQSTEINQLTKDLDRGVVYYPGSVLPSENGQMVILGHSAPPGWPHIKHDWVFTEINSLRAGDTITLIFNHAEYTYTVMNKNILKKGQDVGLSGLEANNNILTLVSCWPPGKNSQRIAVQAQLVK